MKCYNGEPQGLHPIIRGAMLRSIFVRIHPFIIRVENRLAYYNALDKAHSTENYKEFVEFVAKKVEASLDLYLSTV